MINIVGGDDENLRVLEHIGLDVGIVKIDDRVSPSMCIAIFFTVITNAHRCAWRYVVGDIVGGGFKYLALIVVLNIAFQLVSDVSAGKIILVAGVGVSVTVLYFPFTYIISDILTEVYGYSRARAVLWLTMTASILAGIIYQIVVVIPPAPFF